MPGRGRCRNFWTALKRTATTTSPNICPRKPRCMCPGSKPSFSIAKARTSNNCPRRTIESKANLQPATAGWRLAAREHRSKVCLGQDACDFRAFVTLNLDLAVLHRAAGAAGALHRFGQLLLFRQSDADKAFHHRHRLAAASGRLPDNIHAPAVLRCRFGWMHSIRRWIFRCEREPGTGQGGKRVLTQTLPTVGGNTFAFTHAWCVSKPENQNTSAFRTAPSA